MPIMQFKGQFAEAIRRGEKVTTLRRWPNCRMAVGDRVYAQRIGWLRVISARPIELKSLKHADAVSDGFASLEDLFATLKKLYPNQENDGRDWYRIEFKVDELLPVIPASNTRQVPKSAEPLKSDFRQPKAKKGLPEDRVRSRLAHQLRAELDKAVQNKGSLFPI